MQVMSSIAHRGVDDVTRLPKQHQTDMHIWFALMRPDFSLIVFVATNVFTLASTALTLRKETP